MFIPSAYPSSGPSNFCAPLQLTNPHDLVTKLLGNACDWFIAGGCMYADYTDVDVFFPTEEDFIVATAVMSKDRPPRCTLNADTYSFDYPAPEVQLIKRHFGTPLQILADFDLNKSAYAIDSHGKHYYSPDFTLPLCIRPAGFRNSTMSRFWKYAVRKRCTTTSDSIKQMYAIAYASLDTVLDEYYQHNNVPVPYDYREFRTIVPSYIGFTPFLEWLSTHPSTEQLIILSKIFQYNEHFVPLESMSLSQQFFFATTLQRSYYSTIPLQIYSTIPEAFL